MRFKFELINKTQVLFGLKPSVKLDEGAFIIHITMYIKFCRYL